MESYGLMLKKAREEKELSLEDAARGTNISISYLKALEEEDEKVFPGEPYLYGFLKNYAEFLGLNSSMVCVLCKNKKIQEANVPVELLLTSRRSFGIRFLLWGIVLAVFAAGAVFAVFKMKNSFAQKNATVVETAEEVHHYRLSDNTFSKRLYKGDKILVPLESGDIELTVAGTLHSLKIDFPSGRHQIELAEEQAVSLDDRMENEILIYVSDISVRDESRGAEVSMILRGVSTENSSDEKVDASAIELLKVEKGHKVLLSDTRAYPFSINASFRASCTFRSTVDSGEISEAYYTSGEIVTMTPKNGVRLWISNGSAVRLQMIANGRSVNLDVASGGQVLVHDIKWIKDTDGLYKIVVIDVD